ncbi:MAG: restriction endonuclease [Rhodopila sp.]|nr:restriction endonuclease [Rhodopila sp.]
MIRRTVLEWQSIPYGEGESQIPEWAADRLAAVARSSPLGGESGARILVHGRHALRAGQIVGVVAGQDCALEILPKIDSRGGGTSDALRGDIRRRLVHMLAVALDIEVGGGRLTDLSWQGENLLEILIGMFARKLIDAVRLGLPRRYVGTEGDLSVLRGRLNVTRQFTTLAGMPQRVACRYDVLSTDVDINWIMRAAVDRLARLSRSQDNQRMLRELTSAYSDIALMPVATLRLGEVVLDRTNRRWRELISLAKLLLGQRFQTTTVGNTQGFSLLFEMNTLFEEYVARMLGRAMVPEGLQVYRQNGRLYCLEELDGESRPRFQTIPDIIVKRGSQILLIIDTKWKRLSPRIDDAKHGVSQTDVYQMLAYSRVYKCPRLMLLYPHHYDLGGADHYTVRYRVTGSDDKLAIATIDVGLTTDFADRLGALVRRYLSDSLGEQAA